MVFTSRSKQKQGRRTEGTASSAAASGGCLERKGVDDDVEIRGVNSAGGTNSRTPHRGKDG